MTEKLNPYDTNLLAKIEASIKAERKRDELEKEFARVFWDGFNPYDLNHIAIFNKIYGNSSGARVGHNRRPSSTEKGLFKLNS